MLLLVNNTDFLLYTITTVFLCSQLDRSIKFDSMFFSFQSWKKSRGNNKQNPQLLEQRTETFILSNKIQIIQDENR